MTAPPLRRFACTPGGAIARGHRRLARFLGALALLMAAVAVAAFAAGRIGAGLIALLVAVGPLLARGLLRGAEPSVLALGEGALTIVMAADRVEIPLAGARARRLTAAETAHLERLATLGGVTAGTGSFDSHLLGELDLYATDFANAVLLDLAERSLIVTPDDPERFLAALG